MSPKFVAIVLWVIAQVETGNNPDAPRGSHGEVGIYQMLPENAAVYSPEQYLEKCALACRRTGKPITAYNLCAAWNAGPRSLTWHTLPVEVRLRAERAQNLYNDAVKHGKTPVSPPR